VPKKLNKDALWEYALRALGQRAHSAEEIRLKLARRAESAEDVGLTMAKLREYGFADDQRFSEAFASSRLQNQGFGRMRVVRELRNKRVASGIADQAVDRIFAGTDETQLIERYLQRKFRGQNLAALLADQKGLAAAFRRLRAAGFSGSKSLDVLKRYSRTVEDWDVPLEESTGE
jgi:regulatory protein